MFLELSILHTNNSLVYILLPSTKLNCSMKYLPWFLMPFSLQILLFIAIFKADAENQTYFLLYEQLHMLQLILVPKSYATNIFPLKSITIEYGKMKNTPTKSSIISIISPQWIHHLVIPWSPKFLLLVISPCLPITWTWRRKRILKNKTLSIIWILPSSYLNLKAKTNLEEQRRQLS